VRPTTVPACASRRTCRPGQDAGQRLSSSWRSVGRDGNSEDADKITQHVPHVRRSVPYETLPYAR